jgi:dolichyl-phosphate beta-glucosyltransferase
MNHRRAGKEVNMVPVHKHPILSIVLPAYNEASSLPYTIGQLSQFLPSIVESYEIIVVDDGSSDRVAELLLPDDRITYVRHSRRLGKGAALRTGIGLSSGTYIAYTDADLPICLRTFGRALQILEEGGCDAVIGNRRHPSSEILGSSSHSRRFTSWLFGVCIRLTLLPGVADTQCCMKIFQAEVLRNIVPHMSSNGYSFDVELLYLARRDRLRIVECPVIWRDLRAGLGPIGSTRLFVRMITEAARIVPYHKCRLRAFALRRSVSGHQS